MSIRYVNLPLAALDGGGAGQVISDLVVDKNAFINPGAGSAGRATAQFTLDGTNWFGLPTVGLALQNTPFEGVFLQARSFRSAAVGTSNAAITIAGNVAGNIATFTNLFVPTDNGIVGTTTNSAQFRRIKTVGVGGTLTKGDLILEGSVDGTTFVPIAVFHGPWSPNLLPPPQQLNGNWQLIRVARQHTIPGDAPTMSIGEGEDPKSTASGASAGYFRRPDGVYLWGGAEQHHRDFNNVNPIANPLGSNVLRANYCIFPRAGRIVRCGWFNANAGSATAMFRFGIYSHNETTYQPDRLLRDSGVMSNWPDPAAGTDPDQWRDILANLDVGADTMLWMAYIYNDAMSAENRVMYSIDGGFNDGAMGCWNPEVLPTYGGANYLVPSNGSGFNQQLYGWRVAQAFALGMPDPWPAGATPLGNGFGWDINIWLGRILSFQFSWQNA